MGRGEIARTAQDARRERRALRKHRFGIFEPIAEWWAKRRQFRRSGSLQPTGHHAPHNEERQTGGGRSMGNSSAAKCGAEGKAESGSAANSLP